MTQIPETKSKDVETVFKVSAGGVAFRSEGGNTQIAIIKTASEGRWQLPKGLIDNGETAAHAALREVREEAGIECELIDELDTIEYCFFSEYDGTRKRYHKAVHFFLMKYLSGDTGDHDHEVDEATWIGIQDALIKLAFDGERDVVKKAALKIGKISR